METKQRRTRFILVLNVVAGYDAVAVETLRPPQVHAAIFDLSNLQLRGIRGFCEQNAGRRLQIDDGDQDTWSKKERC